MRKGSAVPLRCLIAIDVIIGRVINSAEGKVKESEETIAVGESTGFACKEHSLYWLKNPKGIRTTHLSTYQHVYGRSTFQCESSEHFEFNEELTLNSDIRLVCCSHLSLPPTER